MISAGGWVGIGHTPGGHASAYAPAFIEDRNGMAVLNKVTGGSESGHARANDEGSRQKELRVMVYKFLRSRSLTETA